MPFITLQLSVDNFSVHTHVETEQYKNTNVTAQTLDLCNNVVMRDSLGNIFNNNNNNNVDNRIEKRNSAFITISSLRRKLSPPRTLKWPLRSHVQHVGHSSHATSCATWYEGTAQLLSLTEFKLHLF